MAGASAPDNVAERARRWRDAAHAAVCDVIEPWDHGAVVRATRHPTYWDFNAIRVEDDPGMSVDELIAVADELLAASEHRRFEFDLVEVAEPLRPEFERRGWMTERLVWMRHEAPLPPGPVIGVEEVPYDAVRHLRATWHRKDFPGIDYAPHEPHAREVALGLGARVLAVTEGSTPVGFAQIEGGSEGAEIVAVYVHPDHRGSGRGTALTRTAIEAASDAGDLWIVADDEDRPKDLYGRLGFRPAWRTVVLLRPPQ